MEKQLSEKLPRVEVVDALRGFAVMAILLVHSLEHFIFPVYPVDQPAWLNILNDGVFNVTFTLLAGKSYAIFALLFGFTFYIQSANQQRKGKDFGYRFLWRLLLLVAFATLNAAFFPAGDVLLLFSVVGIVLFVVRKWSDCAILVTAILFLLQPVEWYHYIVGLFDPSHTLPDWGVGAMYKEVAEYTKEGNLWEFLGKNMTFGQKASLYWALGAGRFWQTAKDNIAEYKRRSPVWHAEKLKDPLLIYTNTSDDDVNVVEVESMIRALKAEGKKFEYKIFERAPGAHSFDRLDTYESSKIRLDIYKFMGRYLKPNKPFGSVKELRKAAYKF